MENTIYNCRHVFVLYRGGGGGNWVSRMLENLRQGELVDLELTASGSSHTRLDSKRLGCDYLSFGIEPKNTQQRHHSRERVRGYLEQINKMPVADQVVWSHDYSNLELYRKYFPRSILVDLSTHRLEQRLTALFMRINKIDFDLNSIKPFSQGEELRAKFVSGLMIKQGLLDHGIHESAIQYIVTADQQFSSTRLYSSIYSYLNYYGLLGYLEKGAPVNNRSINMLYPTQESVDFIDRNYVYCPYTIKLSQQHSLNSRWDQLVECGPLIDSYLGSDIVGLDYDVFVYGRVEELIKFFRQVLARSLDTREISYIENQFFKYRSQQNHAILQTPRQYYWDLKAKFFDEIVNLL